MQRVCVPGLRARCCVAAERKDAALGHPPRAQPWTQPPVTATSLTGCTGRATPALPGRTRRARAARATARAQASPAGAPRPQRAAVWQHGRGRASGSVKKRAPRSDAARASADRRASSRPSRASASRATASAVTTCALG